jgi:hypothetical protein
MSMPGPSCGYTDLLDHEIHEKLKREEEERREGKRKRHPLRPSSAGACARRLAYELMEYRGHTFYDKELRAPNTYRLLELGHSVEYSALKNFELIKVIRARYKQQVLSFFELDSIDGQTEKELIEGSCDVVLINEQWKCVMDVKSQKDGWSSAYQSRWNETMAKYDAMPSLAKISDTAWYAEDVEAFLQELGDDFLADNIYQLNLYACSDFLRDRGIDHAVIYKYNKNDSQHYELRFKPSLALYEKVREKFNLINRAVAQKKPELVPRASMLGSMRCAFCDFKSSCWTEDAKKAWYKKMPPKFWPTDTSRLPDTIGQSLDKLIGEFDEQIKTKKLTARLEQEIIKLLLDNQVKKIRTTEGAVYELKYLKSPTEHYELRRSKA